jgi:2-amino-4-hydroxy-6-hydroxymethyldihydropteridine diphosphokinase
MPKAEETPESLLEKLQALEKEFGRLGKKVMHEPRPLDLDLIAFGQETRATPELMLPHGTVGGNRDWPGSTGADPKRFGAA